MTGELNLDIRIEECSSCKNLVIRDDSYYVETPEDPLLIITVPGFTTSKVITFNHENVNIINSYALGLSPQNSLTDLPDGLYTIKYTICPHEDTVITVYHIRQCLAWCEFDSYLKAMFDSCYDVDKTVSKDLQHIEWLLKGAKAFADSCEPEKAIAMHRKAVNMLDQLGCRLEK